MKYIIDRNLYLIQWLSDYEINVTTGYQIEAIRHTEKKWYSGISQIEILRVASDDDIKKYKYEGEPFLCPIK